MMTPEEQQSWNLYFRRQYVTRVQEAKDRQRMEPHKSFTLSATTNVANLSLEDQEALHLLLCGFDWVIEAHLNHTNETLMWIASTIPGLPVPPPDPPVVTPETLPL